MLLLNKVPTVCQSFRLIQGPKLCIIKSYVRVIGYSAFKVLDGSWVDGNAYGVLKCWKESLLVDLIAASAKEEGGQHVHGWKNVSLDEKEASATVVMVKSESEV